MKSEQKLDLFNNIITVPNASRGYEEMLLLVLALTIRAGHPARLLKLPIF